MTTPVFTKYDVTTAIELTSTKQEQTLNKEHQILKPQNKSLHSLSTNHNMGSINEHALLSHVLTFFRKGRKLDTLEEYEIITAIKKNKV